MPKGCHFVALTSRGDERGRLVAIEGATDIPFEIARVYYVFGTREGVTRGLHAHRSLHQVAVAVAGSCTMRLDDGANQVEIRLDNPEKGLTLPPMVWHEMSNFSPNCVLMVLASTPYDETDYIRDHEEFSKLAGA